MVVMALKEIEKNSKSLLSVVSGFSKKPVLLLELELGALSGYRSLVIPATAHSTQQMKVMSEFIYRILSVTDQLLNIYTQKVLRTRKRFLWGLL